MQPVPGQMAAKGEWVNYKTGIRYLYFRMDADNKKASVAIEIAHPDARHSGFCYSSNFSSIACCWKMNWGGMVGMPKARTIMARKQPASM